MKFDQWKTYRTRFLVKAKQLNSALSFIDPLGRQHCGRKGDYLVESSEGVLSIAPRQIFEDIYVAMLQLQEPGAVEMNSDEALDAKLETLQDNFELSPGSRTVEPLNIEEVRSARSSIGRRSATSSRAGQQNDESDVRSKLPQSFRDRRPSPSRLGLM